MTSNYPFSASGVDYAGPILLRTKGGRGFKSYKGYIRLFVCLATKAIHIEVVTDLTSVAFLAAFKRFTGRRGNLYEADERKWTQLQRSGQGATTAVQGRLRVLQGNC